MKITCLIVDDEAIARRGVEKYIEQISFLKLEGSYETALQVSKYLSEKTVDLLFLDIQMPQLSGLEFIRALSHPPLVIIVTAYPNFALEGFELDVLDYLVKPVSFERFLRACHKAKDYHTLINAPTSQTDYFFIKADNRIEKIEIAKILFIEAVENYSTIYTSLKKYMTLLSLKSLEEKLHGYAFLKVHRSYVVALNKIESLEGNMILISSYKIPVSRQLKDDVFKTILEGKYLKRE